MECISYEWNKIVLNYVPASNKRHGISKQWVLHERINQMKDECLLVEERLEFVSRCSPLFHILRAKYRELSEAVHHEYMKLPVPSIVRQDPRPIMTDDILYLDAIYNHRNDPLATLYPLSEFDWSRIDQGVMMCPFFATLAVVDASVYNKADLVSEDRPLERFILPAIVESNPHLIRSVLYGADLGVSGESP